MKRPLAVFDIDGTIFRSSLVNELVEQFVIDGLFPQETRRIYDDAYNDWVNRTGNHAAYDAAVVRAFQANLKGLPFKEIKAATKSFVDAQKNHIFVYPRELIKKLKADGYYLLAISQSPLFVVSEFGKAHGFDMALGTVYDVTTESGAEIFTGEASTFPVTKNKANTLRKVLTEIDVTLEGSVGVGDTEGDIAFLEMVEKQICFNPNRNLYEHARAHGWKVVVERKDVIYMDVHEGEHPHS
jgi:alcohol-forming fatty acyl-CoA reductase